MHDFAQALKAARDQADLTARRVAGLVGVDWRTYRRWEAGEATPPIDKLPDLARVLGCKERDLYRPGGNGKA